MLRLMRLLISLCVVSVVLLLATLVEMWRRTRNRTAEAERDARQRTRRSRAAMTHPRLDFAAGMVERPQNVSRRARQAGRDVQRLKPQPRPDRALAHEDFGDLTDPDLRPPVGRRQV